MPLFPRSSSAKNNVDEVFIVDGRPFQDAPLPAARGRRRGSQGSAAAASSTAVPARPGPRTRPVAPATFEFLIDRAAAASP